MDLTRAVHLVATDQRDFDDILTVTEAIEHVLNIMRRPTDPYVPGSWAVEGDDELAQAYIAVLDAGDTQTAAAIGVLADPAFADEFTRRFQS